MAGKCAANLSIAVTTATTGIRVRDRHLAEKVFDAAVFPSVEVTLPIDPQIINDQERPITANVAVTIKGVKHSVPVTARCRRSGATIQCSAIAATIRLMDFGIEPPKFLGLAVAENVGLSGILVMRDVGVARH